MIHSKNKLLLLILATFVVALSSCYSKVENISSKAILKEVNFNSGATINLKIAELTSFKTKSNSSVPEANLTDVKSLTAFLTTNPTDPFAIGSNPLGDGVMISRDYFLGSNIISFMNVPVGGPYYAVLAAFDDVSGSLTKNNITEGNTTITSLDNKWWLSTNSVNVLPSRNLVFSDASITLDVNLILRKPIANSIGTVISISDGTTLPVQPPININ